jgi:hypothetical protein
MIFQNPPYMASRKLPILRIAAAGTLFSPLPCQAWHGCRVPSAHRVEVEVDADGHASAPSSGAAAAAPPAGAGRCKHYLEQTQTFAPPSPFRVHSGLPQLVTTRRAPHWTPTASFPKVNAGRTCMPHVYSRAYGTRSGGASHACAIYTTRRRPYHLRG